MLPSALTSPPMGFQSSLSDPTHLLLLSQVEADVQCKFVDWKSLNTVPMSDSDLFSWEIIFLLLHQSWKTFFFARVISLFKYMDNQPGSCPSESPPSNTARKDGIMWSHVWPNKTTLAGHWSEIGLCMPRLSGSFVSPLSLFNEELWKASPPPLPTRTSKMRTEGRRCSLGGNQGQRQESYSVFPNIRGSWESSQE